MDSKILEIIKKYDTIIIHGHINPDFDSLGSQFGLKYSLEATFPSKKVFVVNEKSDKFIWGTPDVLPDETFKNALSIVVDVANQNRTFDNRFNLSDFVLIIDHHKNEADFGDYAFIDASYGATAEIIAELVKETELVINKKCATALISGVMTDTGRLQYSNTTVRTLKMYTYLFENGANVEEINAVLSVEPLKIKRLKGYFMSNFKLTKQNVAYMINDEQFIKNSGVDFFTVSRGMVNTMGKIPDVPFWLNFTENTETNKIVCEFRSAKYPIVDIAKKYGGGGHDLACGCSLNSFAQIDEVIADFDRLAKEKSNV